MAMSFSHTKKETKYFTIVSVSASDGWLKAIIEKRKQITL